MQTQFFAHILVLEAGRAVVQQSLPGWKCPGGTSKARTNTTSKTASFTQLSSQRLEAVYGASDKAARCALNVVDPEFRTNND